MSWETYFLNYKNQTINFFLNVNIPKKVIDNIHIIIDMMYIEYQFNKLYNLVHNIILLFQLFLTKQLQLVKKN